MTADPFLRLLATPDPEQGRMGVSAAALDELVERTVLLGGTSETAAQELGIADEATVLELLGQAYRMPTAERSALNPLSDAAVVTTLRAALPRKIAESHTLCPLELGGRRLTVLCTAPADPVAFASALEELGFALSLSLLPVITTEALLARATERVYGTPMSPRLQSVLSPTAVDIDLDLETADESGWSALSPTVKKAPAPVYSPDLAEGSGWRIPSPGESVLPPAAGAPRDAPRLEIVADGTIPADAPATVQAQLAALDDRAEKRRTKRRQKVLWSTDDAIAELALCQTRDDLLEVTLRFAYRRLHTAAIFVRLGQGLTCFDVLDPLLEGDELRSFVLPVEGTHVLARTMALMSPVLGPVEADDPLCRLLGRRPRTVLVAPIMLGKRAIGAIVGDNDDKPIPTSLLGELQRVLPALQQRLAGLVHQARLATTTAAATTSSSPPMPAPPVPAPPARAATPSAVTTPPAAAVSADAETTLPAPAPTAPPAVTMPPAPAPLQPGVGAPAAVTMPPMAPAPSEPTPTASPPAPVLPDVIVDPTRIVAPTPGAQAKEALLQATARAWLAADDDRSIAELVRTLDAPGEGGRAAGVRLGTLGLQAMPTMVRVFPGSGGNADDSADVAAAALLNGPFFEVLARLGDDLIAPVIVHALDADDRRVRFGAVVAARRFALAAAVPGLGRRLLDAEPRVAAMAIDALSHLKDAPGYDAVCGRLRDLCKRGHDHERRLAIRAVAALRDTDAIDALLDLVGARPKELAEEVRSALVELTRQDFGTAERRWRAWYTENRALSRRRWLLMALSHRERSLRTSAADDLAHEGIALLGFSPDDSAGDRHEAIVRLCAALNEPVPS